MKVIASEKVKERASKNLDFKKECLSHYQRHCKQDFGLVDTYIINENLKAIKTENKRVFSAYRTYYGKIWIITDMKTKTTIVLFPDEYRAMVERR